MKYINLLFNFFKSTYLNDSRYNSSILTTLRVLFERETKYRSTPAVFGNVFRNSKWSDLKIQNVKTTSIRHWLYYLLFVFLLISIAILLLHQIAPNSYFGLSALSLLIANGYSFILLNVDGYFNQVLIISFSLYLVGTSLISTFLQTKFISFVGSFGQRPLLTETKVVKSNPILTQTQPLLNNFGFYGDYFYYLHKLNSKLYCIDGLPFKSFYEKQNLNGIGLSFFLKLGRTTLQQIIPINTQLQSPSMNLG